MGCSKRDHGLVSVIVPVYQTPSDIVERQLRSILAQTYDNIEVILVEDGNAPSYCADLQELCRMDPRIRLVSQRNGGPSKARNRGLDESKGDFVVFADADDEVLPGFVSAGVSYLETYGLDAVYGRHISRFAQYDQIKTQEIGKEIEVFEGADLDGLARYFFAHERPRGLRAPRNVSCGPWGKVFRGDVARSCRFDERMDMCEDAVFNSEVIASAKRVGFVDDVWCIYYQNDGSIYHSLEFNGPFYEHYGIAAAHIENRPGFNQALYAQMLHRFICTMNNVVGKRGISATGDVRLALRNAELATALSSIEVELFDVGSSWRVLKALGRRRMALLLVLAFMLKRGRL